MADNAAAETPMGLAPRAGQELAATTAPGTPRSAGSPEREIVLEIRRPRFGELVALIAATLIGWVALWLLEGLALILTVWLVGDREAFIYVLAAFSVPALLYAYRAGRATYLWSRWRWVVWDGRTCWACAYDLTGNASGVCPECGTGYAQEIAGTVHQRSVIQPVGAMASKEASQ